jgi:hypothetical protein
MLKRDEDLRLRPAPLLLIILGLLVSPLATMGALTWIYSEGEFAGTILILGALFVWLWVGTLRIALSKGILRQTRFGFTSWSIESSRVTLKDGLGGDIPILPALIVVDFKSGKRIGFILKVQFRPRDLDNLRSILA